MTKISDVEANLEQFKSETLASQEETRKLFGQMQESIDRNKVEADKQFAEIMQQFKALRPTLLSIAMATTITPPATHPATLPPPLPHHSAAAATPHHTTPPIPLNSQNSYPAFAVTRYPPFPSQPSAAYTSFLGLRDAGGIFANTTVHPTTTVHGSKRGWQPGSDHRLRKLKMPLFDGEDVYGWVYQVERFFEAQGLITTGDRLRADVLSLEGSALSR
ncbi:hypothetical protein Tco_1139642, partial [Tanacetum coccineum]